MDNQSKVALVTAVVGGYVLGRTKKGKLALSVATYLAGRRFGLEPRQLATEGMRKLGEMPQVALLQAQLRDEVLGAARQAVTAGADRGLNTLADAIGDRTARLTESADPDTENTEDTEDEPDDEDTSDVEAIPARKSSSAKKSPSSKKTAAPKKAAGRKTATERNPSAKKTASAKKTTAKETAAKRAAPKRSDRRR